MLRVEIRQLACSETTPSVASGRGRFHGKRRDRPAGLDAVGQYVLTDARIRRRTADATETGDDDTPLEAVAVGAVTLLTLTVAFGLLAVGVSFFWIAFPIGFGGGVPLAVGLARWYAVREADDTPERPRDERDAALAGLRDRYARGGLDEAEFEARRATARNGVGRRRRGAPGSER